MAEVFSQGKAEKLPVSKLSLGGARSEMVTVLIAVLAALSVAIALIVWLPPDEPVVFQFQVQGEAVSVFFRTSST